VQPFTFSRFLVLADCILAAVLAAVIILFGPTFTVMTAVGWLFVVLAVYLGSLLVP
jgi:hypothetical protein